MSAPNWKTATRGDSTYRRVGMLTANVRYDNEKGGYSAILFISKRFEEQDEAQEFVDGILSALEYEGLTRVEV